MIPHGIETPEERRKRRWKERLFRWQKKLGPENVKAYHKKYRAKWIAIGNNKERLRQSQREWSKRNPRKGKPGIGKARYWKHRDTSLEKSKNWYRNNREKALARAKLHHEKNREARLEYLRKWQKDHPEKNFEYNNKRRALELAAHGNLLTIKDFVRKTKSKRTAVCYYCKRRCSSKKIHFDHIVPLAKGGLHSADNLCVSCPECNWSKRTKLIHEIKMQGQQLLHL